MTTMHQPHLQYCRAPPDTEAQDAHKPFVFNSRNGPAMALTFVVIAFALHLHSTALSYLLQLA